MVVEFNDWKESRFGNGEVLITPRGSFKIGQITVQRKGGDGGQESANMLQFKINPAELLVIIEEKITYHLSTFR